MLGNYRVAWHLVASRVVLSSTELLSYFSSTKLRILLNEILNYTSLFKVSFNNLIILTHTKRVTVNEANINVTLAEQRYSIKHDCVSS
jgi:hypothetical protein